MRVTGFIFLLWLISFLSAAENYSVFKENGKVGLKNQQGQIIIPASYESLGWSDNSFSVVDQVTGYELNGLWGIVSINNKLVIKAQYLSLTIGEGSLLIAQKKLKTLQVATGCIKTDGKEVLPFQYDGMKITSLRAIVFIKATNQFKFGLIDLENKKIIPTEYKNIRSIGSLRFAVENFQHKTALFTDGGKQITDFSIDSLSSFKKNYAVIYQNLNQGLIDRDGQIKVQPQYRAIEIQDDGTVRARKLNEWIFLDAENKLLQKIECDSIEGVEKNVFKLKVAGEIQLVDAQFKPIYKNSFSTLGKFEKGKAVFSKAAKYGIIRKSGVVVIDPVYDTLINNGNSLLVNIKQNGRDNWSLIDTLGRKKHTKLYDIITPYNGEFYAVKKNNFWGALNEEGKEIIACVHDSLKQTFDSSVVVKFHNQYGIITVKEDWLVTPQANKLKLVSQDHYLEFTEGNTFLKSVYGELIYFTSNTLTLQSDYLLERLPTGETWKISFSGTILNRQPDLVEPIQKILPESEGLRAIKKDGKYGFIDSRGRLRIANRYENAQSFSEQLAAIQILGKWGFINHEDKIAIQPVYESTASFVNGLAIVKQKGFYGVINKSGKLILPVRYQSVTILHNHRLLVKQDDVLGLADASGKLILAPKYNELEDLNNGYVIIQRNQKYSLLTLDGLSKIPMIYDYLTYDAFNNRYIALKKSEWINLNP
jgi:hypothetical protein